MMPICAGSGGTRHESYDFCAIDGAAHPTRFFFKFDETRLNLRAQGIAPMFQIAAVATGPALGEPRNNGERNSVVIRGGGEQSP